jgi:GntR family transcriptional repressor for pyruvate dehydrogenase complex
VDRAVIDDPQPAGRSAVEASPAGDSPVRRASDVLAEDLRARILSDEISPGTLLPTERDLAEQSGIGRSSVREALKTLEIQGLIVTRPGRSGGSKVVRPTAETLARSVGVFIRGRRVRLPVLIEIRQIIEPACAELAAERRTDADLDELASLTAAMRTGIEDTQTYLAANVDWHVRVAVASHNELLAGVLLAISQEVHAGTEIGKLDERRVRDAAIHAHELICEAIGARDSQLARARMARHIAAYEAELEKPPIHSESVR